MKNNKQERFDIYKLIHKYLRDQIGKTAFQLGSLDFSESKTRENFAKSTNSLLDFILDHAKREEKYIHPLLEKCKSQSLEAVEKDHGKLDQQIKKFGVLLKSAKTRSEFHDLYLTFTVFQSEYLKHLVDEEQKLLPDLQANYTDEKLGGVSKELLKGIPKEIAMKVTIDMLPALNHHERVGLLKTMRKSMPKNFFGVLLENAKKVLSERDSKKLELSLQMKTPIPEGIFNQKNVRPLEGNQNTKGVEPPLKKMKFE